MRKVPILLASALLLTSIATWSSPMMAAAVPPDESPQPTIEITNRDKDDLDITVFAGVITDGRDFLNMSRRHTGSPHQFSSKSFVSVPSVDKLASLQMDPGALAQKLAGDKATLSAPSAADILLSNQHLITDSMDIAQSSSSVIRSISSSSIPTSGSKASVQNSTTKAQGNNSSTAVNAVVPDGKDILHIMNALENADETVSPDYIQP